MLALRSDMTIPIARLVANRYATPSRRCASATSRTPTARSRPQRGQTREFLQAGVELVGAPGARGHGRGGRGAVRGARRRRARPRRDRARRRRALPPAARRARGAGRARGRDPRTSSPTHDLVGLEREVERARPRRRRARRCCDAPAAARRRRGARRGRGSAARPSSGAARAAATRRSPRAAWPSACSSTSACCATSATTRARSSRSTTRRSATSLGGGGRYDDLLGPLRPRRCPRAGFALYLERAAHRAGGGGAIAEEVRDERARPALHGCAGAAARRAARRDARPARRARASTPPRCAPTTRSLMFEPTTWRSSRCGPPTCPTYVEAGAADLGITGKDVLAEQSDRDVYELLDLGYGALPDGVRDAPTGDDRAGRGAAPPRRDADRDQVPADRRAPLRATPGRQAEIIEVKGSVELAPLTGLADGDRRPRRHRHDAARERARGPRGDRRVAPRG